MGAYRRSGRSDLLVSAARDLSRARCDNGKVSGELKKLLHFCAKTLTLRVPLLQPTPDAAANGNKD
jgi:hypothetical protein